MAGKTNWTSLVLGAGTLAVILLLKRSKRLPGVLIAVVGTTVIVGALDLATQCRRVGPRFAASGPARIRFPVDHVS